VYGPRELSKRRVVPAWTIERATRRRLAGDWAGACAAAMIDVDVDLPGTPVEHRRALLDDLHHLVPDLLRSHLPRDRSVVGMMAVSDAYVLARYGTGSAARCLVLDPPRSPSAPQRPVLRVGVVDRDPHRADVADLPRPFWHVDHADQLRRCCGDDRRTAFFHPDGTRLTESELPTGPGEPDSAATIEWVTRLWDERRFAEAFAVVGVDTSAVALDRFDPWLWDAAPHRIVEVLHEAAAGREFTASLSGWTTADGALRVDHAGRVAFVPAAAGPGRILPRTRWHRLAEWDRLRTGGYDPADLHPLVYRALFPAAPELLPTDPPAEPPYTARVRCTGTRHEVTITPHGLSVPHPPEEVERERALAALGGRASGCAAAALVWRGRGNGHLPKALRVQRHFLFNLAQRGDTLGVLAMLDAGHDPGVWSGSATLLHYLAHVDHAVLLPRLLAAGLDVNSADHQGVTPLQQAYRYGSADLVAALLAAGADPAGAGCDYIQSPRRQTSTPRFEPEPREPVRS
jgi:hypothetical protein